MNDSRTDMAVCCLNSSYKYRILADLTPLLTGTVVTQITCDKYRASSILSVATNFADMPQNTSRSIIASPRTFCR